MQEYIASDAVLTTDSGNLTYAIAEKTLDALFVGPWSAFTGKNAIQANCATTKTIMYNAGVEKSVLGTAEWVEFVALFFNREEASGDIVDNIAARYECAVEKAATAVAELSTEEVKYNQTVLWVSYWSELYGWYISACGDSGTDSTRSTWYCEMLNHVGAVSLDYSEFTPGGSLTWEQLHTLDLASVDVVIWAVDDLHAVRLICLVFVCMYFHDCVWWQMYGSGCVYMDECVAIYLLRVSISTPLKRMRGDNIAFENHSSCSSHDRR
jgi:hypothetical protein